MPDGSAPPTQDTEDSSEEEDSNRFSRQAIGVLALSLVSVASALLILLDRSKPVVYVIIASLSAAAMALLAHYQLDAARYAYSKKNTGARPHQLKRGEVAAERERLSGLLTDTALEHYLQGVVLPHLVRQRTRERLTPQTRSVRRTIQHEMRVPANSPCFTPVLIVDKRTLQNFRAVSEGGKGLTTLTFFQSTALAMAVMRRVLMECFAETGAAAAADLFTKIEGNALTAISTRDDPEKVQAALSAVKSHLASAKVAHPKEMKSLARLLDVLATRHVIVVALPQSPEDTRLLKIEDFVVPSSSSNDKTGFRGKMREFRKAILAAFAASPARYRISCALASDARSYHLEFVGPENTYLASQKLVSSSRAALEHAGVYDRWMPRLGQRFAHFYVRRARRLGAPIEVQFTFIERPPGSLAFASIGAVAATLLLVSSLYVGAAEARFIAAALFTLPVASAAWAGFSTPSLSIGQPLGARLSVLATLFTSLTSAPFVLLGGDLATKVGAAFMASISCFSIYWWLLRTLTYSRFARRRW
ncbi:hypothetical protein [Nocardioides marmoraquaticus]